MYYSALIGNPTRHSVSHVLFEELAKAIHLDDAYKHIKVDLAEKDLGNALRSFQDLGFIGLNVTLPFKMAVIPHLDKTDSTANSMGAVNTIKLSHNKLTGYNTDWLGIYKPINRLGQSTPTATILGSGGAARAAIYAAKRLGATKINVVYRNKPKDAKTDELEARADKLRIELYDYSEIRRLVNESELIINATSAGMVGNSKTPFELRRIAGLDLSNKIYFDAVFNPLQTPLLAYFRRHGSQTVDGLWMMIYQAVAAMGIWLDVDVSVERKDLERIHNLLVKELQHV